METKRTLNNRLIIGFGYKARQGKDTAAAFLAEKYGCRIIHFADALYEECTHAEILFKGNPPVLYLKAAGEAYFHFPDPPQVMVNWIHTRGEKRNGLPFDAELYYGGMQEKDGTLLQFWGTEFRRKCFYWDYWVDKVKMNILAHPDDDFLVPDTRFRNEARMVKDMGGFLWKIYRGGYISNDRDPNHTSEIDLDSWEFDAVIVNDGTIPELLEKVDRLFLQLKGF